MTEGKLINSSSAIAAKTDDLVKDRETDNQNNKQFTSRRIAWLSKCVVVFMVIATICLAIGLGIGMKSNDTSLSSSENVTRSSWPELVGMDAENASAWMKENHPEYNVYVINYGEYVTADYDTKRVRIYKAPNGTVFKVPKIGR